MQKRKTKAAPVRQVRDLTGAEPRPDQERASLRHYTLYVNGKVPAKKNNLGRRVGPGRGLMYDRGTQARIAAIAMELGTQWKREPLPVAKVHCWIYTTSRRADGDGILTTILDALKAARVIQDDNMLRVPEASFNAIECDEDHVMVEVREVAG